MPVGLDPDPKLAQYAHPERLVTTAWLAEHLGDPGLVVVESDEDVLLYDIGHIPGAHEGRLAHRPQRPGRCATTSTASSSRSCSAAKGIARDTTVVFYGDKNNWWAAYAFWVFTLFGHEDVRLLDGGRAKWDRRGPRRSRPTCPTPTPSSTPSPSATTRRSAPSRTTCSRTSAKRPR